MATSLSLEVRAKKWFENPVSKEELLKYKQKDAKESKYLGLFPELKENKIITRRMLILNDGLHHFIYFSEETYKNKYINRVAILYSFKDKFKKDLGIKSLEKTNKIWNKTMEKLKKEKKKRELEDFLKPSAAEIKFKKCLEISFCIGFVSCLILIAAWIILVVYLVKTRIF